MPTLTTQVEAPVECRAGQVRRRQDGWRAMWGKQWRSDAVELGRDGQKWQRMRGSGHATMRGRAEAGPRRLEGGAPVSFYKTSRGDWEAEDT